MFIHFIVMFFYSGIVLVTQFRFIKSGNLQGEKFSLLFLIVMLGYDAYLLLFFGISMMTTHLIDSYIVLILIPTFLLGINVLLKIWLS